MNATKATDFKHALFEGKVEFDYVKNDGTIRHANGTMNAALLPKSEPMVTFKCTEIKWHAEDSWPINQTLRATVHIPEAKVNSLTTDDLEVLIANTIPEVLGQGYAESFRYERLEKSDKSPKKLPAGSVFYYDLDKNGFRSFKLANLKGWKAC